MGPTGLSCCVKDQDTGNLRDTELRLGLPGTGAAAQEKPTAAAAAATRGSKRALPADTDKTPADLRSGQDPPPAKAQVVGWPPVRANRMRNTLPARKEAAEKDEAAGLVMYVKVSMDGAPYLRKIDLKIYRGYRELRDALDGMFNCFSLGGSGSEYAIAYEDKDGDLMMVGDVPWEMFNPSCKRLRIMKATEAKGLQSRQ